MTTDRLLTVGVALVCIVAVGSASTTLESTLSTDPDDVIDVDHRDVPLGKQQVSRLREDLQGAGERDQAAETNPSSGGETEAKRGGSEAARSGSERRGSGGGDSPRTSRTGEGSGDDGFGSARNLLERLFALLLSLLPYVLGVGLLVLIGVLVRRYRDRLWSLLSTDRDGRSAPPDGSSEVAWHGEGATDPVTRAWVGMVAAAGVERPWTKTTRECAREARGAGLDEDAVATLTRTFEEVRYASAPVTEDRVRRARAAVDRFGPRVSP